MEAFDPEFAEDQRQSILSGNYADRESGLSPWRNSSNRLTGKGIWNDADTEYRKSQEQRQSYVSCHYRGRWGVREVLTTLFCTDLILKLFAILFYGILPCGFKTHRKKLHYIWITLILTFAQWSCFLHYIYFVVTYWSSHKYGPIMPEETVFIQMALVASGAVTYTLAVHFLYRKSNNFSSDGEWNVIPGIKFQLATVLGDEKPMALKKKDWILTNIFLLLGIMSTISVVSSDFKLNVFYDFYGIHDFVAKLSWPRKIQYFIAVSTEFFGLGATACACCIFYAITRDLIRHIEYTENAILIQAKNKDDFYFYHESLHDYSEKMIASFKHWFAIHNMFFIVLVAAVVYEWFKLMKHEKEIKDHFHDMLVAQIAGSSLIAFKFAFPFISASRVTMKYVAFYFNLARKCKINGIPDLSILSNNSGFKLYGLRITTSIAFLAFFASFAGALKFISGLRY